MKRSKMTPKSLLLLLLLLLWVSYEKGSLGEEDHEEVQKVVGETLTVRCQYTPQSTDHLDKAWCKQKNNQNMCTLLISRPQPTSMTEDPRYSLSYDNGVITVNMAGLRVEDSGGYWCGNHNVSTITILKRVYLTVATAQIQTTTNSEVHIMTEATTIASTTSRSHFITTDLTNLMYIEIQPPENSTSISQIVNHIDLGDLRFPNCLLTLVVFGVLLIKGLAFVVLLVLLFRFRNQGNGDTRKEAKLNKLELCKISPYLSSY
ncbi:uncharacterized protein LOC141523595 [Macrotis lagotis]|uniref:uncharacterized protein LOC141523595 n=1 Tax=Macrotis lagotis TaxID=92651 RepID=UPI003D68EFA4